MFFVYLEFCLWENKSTINNRDRIVRNLVDRIYPSEYFHIFLQILSINYDSS